MLADPGGVRGERIGELQKRGAEAGACHCGLFVEKDVIQPVALGQAGRAPDDGDGEDGVAARVVDEDFELGGVGLGRRHVFYIKLTAAI